MRQSFINYLKQNPRILDMAWSCARIFLNTVGLFTKTEKKIVFASFGGRKFDDSPKALYDEICRRKAYADWDLVWAFNDPDKFDIPRGRKVKVDTPAFFKELLTAKVWISNSGADRGIGFSRKGLIHVETWHGTPLKKIGGEENKTSMRLKHKKCKTDSSTIRCAQSDFDRDIFVRIFHATKESFILADLPRNDALLKYKAEDVKNIREKLNIPEDKQVILYVPTYREYLVNKDNETYLAPPMDLKKWKDKFGDKYVLLFRAHYAVNIAMNLKEDEFVRDASDYENLNDLYAIADLVISDYSSVYFDYSILDRPMFCFAYDLEEYEEERGLYLDLKTTLPCPVDRTEDEVINHILTMDKDEYIRKSKEFHKTFAPHAGHASKTLVNEISKRISGRK